MFKRPHHQRILKALEAFDAQVLLDCECFFAGGTAIAMALDEFRESIDIDFLCASQEGYRAMRNMVGINLGPLLKTPLKHLRDVRVDRYGIRTFVEIDGVAIKLEIVSEGRIPLQGGPIPGISVPMLSKNDLYAEKLLANADRGLDRSVTSRDIIDLAHMVHYWGPIPQISWQKAELAYGAQVRKSYENSVRMISEDAAYLGRCLQSMKMAPGAGHFVLNALGQNSTPEVRERPASPKG